MKPCGHCKRDLPRPAITVRVSLRAARTGVERVDLDLCWRCYVAEYAARDS